MPRKASTRPTQAEIRQLRAEIARLRDENQWLQRDCDVLRQQWRHEQRDNVRLCLELPGFRILLRAPQTPPPRDTVPRSDVSRLLRQLLAYCHPDKWGGSAVATDMTKHLNALRAQYLK